MIIFSLSCIYTQYPAFQLCDDKEYLFDAFSRMSF